MTPAIVDTYERRHLDAIVCLGGGGTQKNALRLAQAGLNVVTLPKTIDNDVAETDATFGFATALEIATEAIDRLHSTAHSHHRIIVAEIMGHRAGWLTLAAGIAGGADVILIPEIPYDVERIVAAIRRRSRLGHELQHRRRGRGRDGGRRRAHRTRRALAAVGGRVSRWRRRPPRRRWRPWKPAISTGRCTWRAAWRS